MPQRKLSDGLFAACALAVAIWQFRNTLPDRHDFRCLAELSATAQALLRHHVSQVGGLKDIADKNAEGGYLSLSNARLCESDVQAIFELAAKFPGIRQLGLTNNPLLGPEGVKLLAIGFKQDQSGLAQRLEGVYISGASASDDGVTALMSELSRLPYVQRLSINSNGVTDRGAANVAEHLMRWEGIGLHTLGVSGNNMSHGVVEILQAAEQVATPLAKLFLNENAGGDSAARAAAALILSENGLALKRLGLASNEISEEGALFLHRALLQSSQVEFVCVYDNPIGAEMFHAMRRLPNVNVKVRGGHTRLARHAEWWHASREGS